MIASSCGPIFQIDLAALRSGLTGAVVRLRASHTASVNSAAFIFTDTDGRKARKTLFSVLRQIRSQAQRRPAAVQLAWVKHFSEPNESNALGDFAKEDLDSSQTRPIRLVDA